MFRKPDPLCDAVTLLLGKLKEASAPYPDQHREDGGEDSKERVITLLFDRGHFREESMAKDWFYENRERFISREYWLR
jgi:hypothetical protein